MTFQTSVECARTAAELMSWCQSAQSRAHWPGVEQIRWDDTSVVPRLYYDVHLDAPGAPKAVAAVEEHMCRPEEDDAAIFFESSQIWLWPTNQVAGCWATYRFVPIPEGTRFQFTYRYMLPGLGGGEELRRTLFSRSAERAVELYVHRVVRVGIGPEESRQPVHGSRAR